MVARVSTSIPYADQATSWWTRIKPKSFRSRLAWLAACLLCLIQLVMSALFYSFTSSWLFNQVNQNLQTTAVQVAAAIQDDGEMLEQDDIDFQFAGSSQITNAFLRESEFFIRVIDTSSGDILSENMSTHVGVTALARNGTPGFETLELPAERRLVRIYTLPLHNSVSFALQVGQSLNQVGQIQGQMLRLLLLMLAATALLTGGSGWFLAQRALNPISAMTRTAQAFSDKDLSQRIPMTVPDDELGQLAQTFNRMFDRIEESFQRQRQFTADAAHELRTPLAIMQTGLDVTLSQPRTGEEYRAVLDNIYEEVLRLSQLSHQLLLLARADTHSLTIERQPMDMSLMINTVIDQVVMAAEQKHIDIQRDIPPSIIIHADEDRLIQLTLNLVENAVKYTPSGGGVAVKLTPAKDQLHLSVADTGIGIPAHHLPHIFKRFYRVDPTRNRQQGGAGLGLAIAQQIAQLHGGSISVSSQPGAGSEFIVTLPTS